MYNNTHQKRFGPLQTRTCEYRYCDNKFKTRDLRKRFCEPNHSRYESAAIRAEQARLYRESLAKQGAST